MEISKTKLDGVLSVKPPTIFEDFRGTYVELYNEKLYKEAGIHIDFIQDDISVSSKNVLRGIHGDKETWKLISCLYGKFYLVVVNCDLGSKDFGKWEAFVLSARSRRQILIPPGYGNGHLVLSRKAIFHYKQSTYYNPSGQFTYTWDDPRLNINWPTKKPILSERDSVGRFVK